MGDRKAATDMVNAAITAANDRSQQGHIERAYNLFCSSTLVDPTFSQAFYHMGNANADMTRLPAAIASWRRALECENSDEDKARILTNLGWFSYANGNIDDAYKFCMEAIALAPDNSAAHCNLSVVLGVLDRGKDSVASARRSLELDPSNIQHEIALAFALLHDHQFSEGLTHFEKRFPWRLHQYQHAPYPQWKGEPDGTLYLMSDQGLGDTLSFARFVEAASKRCKFIHASVHPELMRLFSHAFLHIRNINLIPQPSPFPQADYWSTFVSLPHALGLTDSEIVSQPHITCPKISLTSNWKVPDRKLHIGIAWKGNARSDIDKYRSIPFTQFLELYKVPGIQLYGLQMDAASNDLYEHGAAALVRDLKPYVNDVTDTVGILQHLDMVICLESAIGHVCGLAGKECWIPYSFFGRDYRLGLTGESPVWYPKHRVFRQQKNEGWGPAFERINEALREKIDGNDPAGKAAS